jgi:hypothetical protein
MLATCPVRVVSPERATADASSPFHVTARASDPFLASAHARSVPYRAIAVP